MTSRCHDSRILAAILVASACGGDEDADPAPREAPGGTDHAAVCLRAPTFVADGPVETGSSGPDDPAAADADQVAAFRWERHEGCERFVIDLKTQEGDAAERPGRVVAAVHRELGVVRVALRDVEGVAPDAADAGFDGPLARGAYALFSDEGRWVDVDVHLGAPAEASVTTLSGPARVVVDLRSGGGPVPGPPSRSDRVVILRPRPGTTSYPLTIEGYARTFEANVVVRLEHEGEEVHHDFTTATAWADAWGHYSFTIPDGPTGGLTLHVGEHSARDGSWEGVAVPLAIRPGQTWSTPLPTRTLIGPARPRLTEEW